MGQWGLKGIISWEGLDHREKELVLGRHGERCNVCRSVGKIDLFTRAYIANNCLNDLTLLYLMKRAVGIRPEKAKKQTVEAAVAWTKLKIRDDLLDSDKSLIDRALSYLLLRSNSKRSFDFPCSFMLYEKKGHFDSLEEWLDCVSSPFRIAFEHGTPEKYAKVFGRIGQNLGKVTAIRDAIDDEQRDLKTGTFNPLNHFPKDKTIYTFEKVCKEVSRDFIDFSNNLNVHGRSGEIVKKTLMFNTGIVLPLPIMYTSSNGGCSTSSSSGPDICTLFCVCSSILLCVGIIAEIWEHSNREAKRKELEGKVARLEEELKVKKPLTSPISPHSDTSQIKCKKCGTWNPSTNKFCGKCGTPVGESARGEEDPTLIYDNNFRS